MEKTVNERVKLVRNHFGLKQEEFGNRLGTTMTTISRIELGGSNPRQSTLNKIITDFNVSRDWLLYGKGEMLAAAEKPAEQETSWRDEAYAAVMRQNEYLLKEVEWLKGLVSKMTGTPNFRNAVDRAGSRRRTSVDSVRAAA